MNNISEPLVTIATAIVGLAIIAVLVSNRAQTANVASAFGGAFSNAISAAVSPVTGQAASPNVNAGTNSLFSGSGLTSLPSFNLNLAG
jgi:hypothetical protein